MNDNILYDTPAPQQTAPKRPTFLTVLCILTFVGCSLAILTSVYSYFTAEQSAAAFDTSMGDLKDVDQLGVISQAQLATQKAAENALPHLIIGLVCPLLCLFGAIQMWQLRKTGFYIYSVGEIAAPVAGFFLSAGTTMELATNAVALVFSIAFVIMYGVNLKHMK